MAVAEVDVIVLSCLIDSRECDTLGGFSMEFADQAFLIHVRIIVRCEENLYLNSYLFTYT